MKKEKVEIAKHKIKSYGWKPQFPDHRDLVFQPLSSVLSKLPSSVDLRSQCPSVYDQGQLGSCTANAIGSAVEFELRKQALIDDFIPSRLFIYYNERVIEGTVNSDSGAMIRDGIKTVNKQGVCAEALWSYSDNTTQFKKKPTAKCVKEALNHKVITYQSVTQDLSHIQASLASGYPVIIGFSVYDGFESDSVAKTGVVNLPAKTESLLGGHAVLIVGYDNTTQRFIVRNSWGSSWGQKGYFTIPYTYFTNSKLASDLWNIEMVQVSPVVVK